jgi:hypothetical protein
MSSTCSSMILRAALMRVGSRFFAREEVESVPANTENSGTHAARISDPLGSSTSGERAGSAAAQWRPLHSEVRGRVRVAIASSQACADRGPLRRPRRHRGEGRSQTEGISREDVPSRATAVSRPSLGIRSHSVDGPSQLFTKATRGGRVFRGIPLIGRFHLLRCGRMEPDSRRGHSAPVQPRS